MSKYRAQHANPLGPGDSRPTALQVIKDEGLTGKLAGKVALITGANQGIGFETARALYDTGATVFLGVRDLNKGQQAIDKILSTSDHRFLNTLHTVQLSLDSLQSVREGVMSFHAQTKQLNILILNAGVMATPEGKTKDGFETQFGTNHLGHFLLTNLLVPTLLNSVTPDFNSRVVSLSSMAHRCGGIRFEDLNFETEGSYNPWVAYGQSKTANIYMANEIERRYGAEGVHGISVHPGNIATNLAQYLSPEQVKIMKEDKEMWLYFKTPEQGAATTVYAAVGQEWEGCGGFYLAECAQQSLTATKNPFDTKDVGYAAWAFDENDAIKLWDISSKLVDL